MKHIIIIIAWVLGVCLIPALAPVYPGQGIRYVAAIFGVAAAISAVYLLRISRKTAVKAVYAVFAVMWLLLAIGVILAIG